MLGFLNKRNPYKRIFEQGYKTKSVLHTIPTQNPYFMNTKKNYTQLVEINSPFDLTYCKNKKKCRVGHLGCVCGGALLYFYACTYTDTQHFFVCIIYKLRENVFDVSNMNGFYLNLSLLYLVFRVVLAYNKRDYLKKSQTKSLKNQCEKNKIFSRQNKT